MKVTLLKIKNFRGIQKADLYFSGHTLMVGGNNVGKSTICEALDLVLGPDRLNRFPPVQEYDFYNAVYIDEEKNPIPIEIEVILTQVSDEIQLRCRNHLEYWHKSENRLLEEGEIDKVDEFSEPCLRIVLNAAYDPEEDEFEAGTYFSHSPDSTDEKLSRVSKAIKRSLGFIYLRTLRTGSRALSLERGSLLDVILRIKEARSGLWEETRTRLHDMSPPIDEGAVDLLSILKEIENRLNRYIPIASCSRPTKLHVSNLTREHLRKTLSFFITVCSDQVPVPFQQVGTGMLNTLVLALLSFIAEIKKDNVIFAMEEPEIALPPHTQRRIADYLLKKTAQCFVTTHSPYVIECFSPEQINILKRNDTGRMSTAKVDLAEGLKAKTYRKFVRRALAEGMLSNGVIVGEGITEVDLLHAVAEKMENADKNLFPFDLSGVTIISADGDGSISEFGKFFKSLNIKVFAFYDFKKRSDAENKKIKESFDLINEIDYLGMEKLLSTEVPVHYQWNFLCHYRDGDTEGKLGIPFNEPDEKSIREHTTKVLKAGKGEGRAAELLAYCEVSEIPESLTDFMTTIYELFERPEMLPNKEEDTNICENQEIEE